MFKCVVKTDKRVAVKIHIPNRPNKSSKIGSTEVISGTSTSFAVNPKTNPIIEAKIIDRYSISHLFTLNSSNK